MSSQNSYYDTVQVTQFKISKPFLKIFARNVLNKNFKALEALKEIFDSKPVEDEVISEGELYIVRVRGGAGNDQYERCRVIQVNKKTEIASVLLIDCGFCMVHVTTDKLRSIDDKRKIQSLPPFCLEFTLAGIKLSSDDGYRTKLEKLHHRLLSQYVQLTVVSENEAGKFAEIRIRDKLVNDDIFKDPELSSVLKRIHLKDQMEVMMQRLVDLKNGKEIPDTFVESPGNSRTPIVGTQPSSEIVKIMYYEDGVQGFYVRFQSKEPELRKMHLRLNKIDSIEKLQTPSVGSICLYRDVDNLYYRVKVVSSGEPNYLKVFFMDKGPTVNVKRSDIFKIPDEFASIPPYARHFKLADYNSRFFSHLNQDAVDFYFEHATNKKQVKIKILSFRDSVSETSAIPLCRLFVDDVNVLDVIRESSNGLQFKESDPTGLKIVNVSYATSPADFYVQPIEEPEEYEAMNKVLGKLKLPPMKNPKVDKACIVCDSNGNSVRGLITGQKSPLVFTVLHVDTGFSGTYTSSEIKIITGDLVKLPPFAVHCLLRGFDKDSLIHEITKNDFIEIAKQQKAFGMSLVEKEDDNLFIVELTDHSTGVNIIKYLRHLNTKENLNCLDWSDGVSTTESHFGRKTVIYNSHDPVFSMTESPDLHCREQLDLSLEDDNDPTLRPQVQPENWNESFKKSSSFSILRPKDHSENWDDFLEKPNSSRRLTWSPLVSNNVKKVPSPTSSGVSSSTSSTIEKSREAVRITAVTKPSCFTIQEVRRVSDYNTFVEKLQEKAVSMDKLLSYSTGSTCLAKNPFEDSWCRAKILDSDTEDFLVSVRSVDDGTTFSVTEKSSLKKISLDLITGKEFFGTQCALPIKYNSRREDDVSAYLNKVMNGNLSYQVIAKCDDLLYVELYNDGKKVTNFLESKGLAQRLQIFKNGHAFVVHVESLDEFWIQHDSDTKALEAITNYVKSHTCTPIIYPKIGMKVMTYDEENKVFLRAQVTSVAVEGFGIVFIDLGSSTVVQKVWEITDPKIAEIHPLAIKCSLLLPENRQWHPDAVNRFKRMANYGNSKFFIKMVSPGDEAATVEIFDEGGKSNILDHLASESVSNSRSSSTSSSILSDSPF